MKFKLGYIGLEESFDSQEDLEYRLDELYAESPFHSEDIDFIEDETGQRYESYISVRVKPVKENG